MRKLAVLLSLLVVAACGDDDPVRHLDGGITIDSPMQMIDAPVMTDPVSLTITLGGQAQPDIKVYFLNPDSSVVSNTTTDASGVASAVMMNGGSVTAINPFLAPSGAISYDLYTFTGVKPGDHLELSNNGESTLTTVTVTAPEDTDPNTFEYDFTTPCGSTFRFQTPGSGAMPVHDVTIDGSCGAATDFLVTSYDSSGKVLHYFYVQNETLASTIDFSAKAWVAPSTRTYEISNTGVFNDYVFVQDRLSSTKGVLGTFDTTPTSQVAPYTFSLDAPAFTNALSAVDTGGYQTSAAEHHIVEWGPFSTTQYTLDVGAKALVDFATDPAVNGTAHTIAWTETATGQVADLGLGVVTGFRSTTGYWNWQIIGPHTDTALHFPTLPTDVADFDLGTADSADVNFLLVLKLPGGYDAVRADLFSVLTGSSGGLQGLMTSATGTLVGASWEPNRGRKALRPAWLNVRDIRATALEQLEMKTKTPKRALSGRRK